MDVLSDVLRAVRLTGALYFDIHARAPWVAATPPMSSICSRVMPGFEHVIAFHIMMDGECWAALDDDSAPAVHLMAGDAVLIPGGEPHGMASAPGERGMPDVNIYYRPKDRTLPFVFEEFGGSGDRARFVCGYLGCDARPFNPILDALPRLMHVKCTGEGGGLTCDLIRLALKENEQPRAGRESFLAKLSELMFLNAVRQHIDSMPAQSTGWLAGLRDRHVGAALRLMHGRPAEAWTIDALAREVGLSRSVFAERFSALMGDPPMHYLGNWRLQLAARLLESQSTSIAQAAAEVGYESEAAFNRAFKKQVGVPPGAWRRARSGGGAAAE